MTFHIQLAIAILMTCHWPAIQETSSPLNKTITLPGNVPLQLRWIPPGTFQMGSAESEAGRDADEGPLHEVTLTRGFYLGIHEVTQAQWKAVMGTNPSIFVQGENPVERPVDSVSWEQCRLFIARLNALGLGKFRLPTEAEWEYACRAGTRTRFYWGDGVRLEEAHAYAWANSRSYATTHSVGGKRPNGWGLYDMSGNVWEWCGDWYGPYSADAQTDPTGPAQGREKVFRGGSWYDFPISLRSANRHRHAVDRGYTAIGLRLVMEEGGSR